MIRCLAGSIVAVLSKMRSSVHRRQVGYPVIERVPVEVVDDVPTRERTVCRFPHHNGARTPHIRVSHLYPCALVAFSAASPVPDSSDRQPIVWGRAGLKLSRWRVPRPLRRAVIKIASPDGGTFVRAIVGGAPFRWPSSEHDAADGAVDVKRCSWAASSGPISRSAFARAEQQPALVALEPVRLHAERVSTVGACHIDHAGQSTGTGTTLAVATGHGRNALGIDIDPRNLELAYERIGGLMLTDGPDLPEWVKP